MRFVLLAMLCVTAGACRGTERAQTAAPEELIIPVAVRPAVVGRIRPVLHVSGIMIPAAGAEFLVFAPEPARVVEVTKKEGEAVTSGELLVRFDLPSASADAARLRADFARARADLENARAAQARAREFAERGLIARRDLEDADRTFTDAQTALARAEVAQRNAEQSAARAIVRAPFAGVVAKRLHDPGDVVQGTPTDPILRLVDPKRLEVLASVPAKELSRVLPGASGRLSVARDAKEVRLSVASRPGPQEVAPSGEATVRLTLLQPATNAVDTPVQVDIDLEERANAVLVPAEAILRTGTTAAVFVAAGDRAERRDVTTGAVDDRGVEITSGVRAGELVITRGHTGLQDGTRINVDTSAR